MSRNGCPMFGLFRSRSSIRVNFRGEGISCLRSILNILQAHQKNSVFVCNWHNVFRFILNVEMAAVISTAESAVFSVAMGTLMGFSQASSTFSGLCRYSMDTYSVRCPSDLCRVCRR